ncbi:MAG: exodeoxyribonuclease VII small subunit [Zoogloeaceae bacterium]|nr:exodeoxyribonuclease VII small subunit [Zoogloeaceae bacterium]
MKHSSAAPTPPPVSGMKFESALSELENLVHSMEAGQLPLEESLAAYRRGAELLQHCQGLLADAEEKVRVLEDGKLRPLDTDGKDSKE